MVAYNHLRNFMDVMAEDQQPAGLSMDIDHTAWMQGYHVHSITFEHQGLYGDIICKVHMKFEALQTLISNGKWHLEYHEFAEYVDVRARSAAHPDVIYSAIVYASDRRKEDEGK